MNVDVYIFGKLGEGENFFQYPNGGSNGVFSSFESRIKAPAQILICRKDSLVHYAYIRRLSKTNNIYLAVGIVLNGQMCCSVSDLSKLCCDSIVNVFMNGDMFDFNDAGNTVVNNYNVESLNSVFNQAIDRLNAQINEADLTFQKLPICDLAIGQSESKILYAIDDKNIERAFNDCNNVYAYEKSHFDRINKFANKFQTLREKNQMLQEELNTIKKERRDEETGDVIVAIFRTAMVLGAIYAAFYFFGDKIKEFATAITGTDKYKTEIAELQIRIDESQAKIVQLTKEKSRLSNENSRCKKLIQKVPIIVSDVEIANLDHEGNILTQYGAPIWSYRTMYLKPKISYEAFSDMDNVDIYVRLYTPSGDLSTGGDSPNGYSNKTIISVRKGFEEKQLVGWGSNTMGNWSAGEYYIEIWCNDICLKAKNFWIY